MSISPYRAGYQPMKAPAVSIRSYGTAGKWSAEAVRSRGVTTNAADLFLGPQQTGPDWAAVLSGVNGGSQTAALQDYVKRNVDKFSGGTLQAMLEATDLVDWYKQKMQDEIAATAKSIEASLAEADLSSLTSDRTKSIMAALSPARAPTTATAATTPSTTTPAADPAATTDASAATTDGTTAPTQGVDITV